MGFSRFESANIFSDQVNFVSKANETLYETNVLLLHTKRKAYNIQERRLYTVYTRFFYSDTTFVESWEVSQLPFGIVILNAGRYGVSALA